MLAGAEAASKQTLVQMVHPEWDETQVNAEVQRIYSEIGFDLANRARVMLAEPANSTADLTQEAQQLAGVVKPPNLPTAVPGDSATGTTDMAKAAKKTTIKPAARSRCRSNPGGLHESLGGKFGPRAQKQANLATGMLTVGRKTAARSRSPRRREVTIDSKVHNSAAPGAQIQDAQPGVAGLARRPERHSGHPPQPGLGRPAAAAGGPKVANTRPDYRDNYGDEGAAETGPSDAAVRGIGGKAGSC